MTQFMKHYKNNFTPCRLYKQTSGMNTEVKDYLHSNNILQ